MRINSLDELPAQYQEQARHKLAAQPQRPILVIGQHPLPVQAGEINLTVDEFELSPPEDPKAVRKTRHLEAAEQIDLMDRVRRSSRPELALIAALANENAAGKGIGVLRWKMGVRAGLPDIGVFVPRTFRGRPCHGLFLEMKRQDGVASDVSDNQEAWHEALEASGYAVVVCYGWRRAWAVLCDYLGWED